MELNQQVAHNNSIVSVQVTQVELAHTTLKIPCFVSANYHTEVAINTLEALDKAALFPLTSKDEIDVLIIGTAVGMFIPPKQQLEIMQMGIGLESMNTSSACRSFNLLLSDRRRVGLLLL